MTIKSKAHSTYIFLIIIQLIFFLIGSGHMPGNLIYFWIFAFFLSFYVVFTSWIFNGRTIVMDESGCEVSFFRIKKKYSWAELKTKRLELYLIKKDDIRKGVVFCTKCIGEMNWSHPIKSAWVRPYLGYFYVIFPGEKDAETWKSMVYNEINPYEVNEQEFMQKMKEWNVWIENGLPKNKHWSEW